MENFIKRNAEEYKKLLAHYLESQDEQSLYGVELVSKAFIKQNILPEEIINLHIKALKELYPGMFEEFEHSMDFLLPPLTQIINLYRSPYFPQQSFKTLLSVRFFSLLFLAITRVHILI